MSLEKQEIEKLLHQNSEKIKLKDKPGKSDVWKKFKEVEISGNVIKDYVVCSICRKLFFYDSKNGISNLKRHVKCQIPNMNQPSLQTTFLSRHLPDSRKQKLNEAAITFITKDLRPLSVLDGPGFKILAQELVDLGAQFGRVNVKDIFFTRKTLTENYLTKMYDTTKKKIINEIKGSLENGVSFTTDFWTDQMRNISYMSLTAHVVTENFQLHPYFLTIKDFPEKKTSENICSRIFQVIQDFFEFSDHEFVKWKNEDNFCFVTDNGANIVGALKSYSRVSCAAHNLNLAVELFQKNLINEDILKLISSSKDIVTFFKRTGLNNKLKYSLKQAVPTRWNSLLIMFKSLDKSYDEVYELLSGKRELSKFLDINRTFLKDLIVILSPLETATSELSKEFSPTMHLVLPWRQKLLSHLEPNYDSDSEVKISLKISLRDAVDSKFKLCVAHHTASFLDPRMKTLKMLSSTEKEEVIEHVQKQLSDIIIPESSITATSISERTSKRMKLCEVEDFFDCAEEDTSGPDVDELEKYRNYPKVTSDTCPLNFWSENKSKFPKLSKLAQFIFSIPATSTSSERGFSLAGRTIEKRRANLSPAHIEKILFLKYNSVEK